jgi:IS5 family transposase
MLRNYLKGHIGDAMNLFMACAAFNFRKFIRKMYFFCFKLLRDIIRKNNLEVYFYL